SGITLMCFYSVAAFKYLMPFEKYGYDGVFVIMIIFAFAWGGDGIAYFAGRKFGKHKLSPSISPNKTVEGAVGAVFGSMIIGVLITVVCTYIKPILEGLPQARQLGIGVYLAIIPLGAICAVLGMAGDLFASSIKRQMEIKDYGNIFPGHGGILDRFDSLILITPFILSVLYIVKMFGVNL
ncbi:MAG: phosphatidate cytidylyltransferase, partial [Oscillospiraceae bacterium]